MLYVGSSQSEIPKMLPAPGWKRGPEFACGEMFLGVSAVGLSSAWVGSGSRGALVSTASVPQCCPGHWPTSLLEPHWGVSAALGVSGDQLPRR